MMESASTPVAITRHQHTKCESVDFSMLNQPNRVSVVSLPPLQVRPASPQLEHSTIEPLRPHLQQSISENINDDHTIEILSPDPANSSPPSLISPVNRKDEPHRSGNNSPTHGNNNELISPTNRSGIRLSPSVQYPPSPSNKAPPPPITVQSSRATARNDRRTTSLNSIVVKTPVRVQSNPAVINSITKIKSQIQTLSRASSDSVKGNGQVHIAPGDAHERIKNFALDLDGRLDDGNEESSEDSTKQKHDATSEHKASSLFSSFSAHLHLFSYVLLLAGLRQNTSRWYRNWLRVVTYGCAILCAMNIGLHTKSYRNVLFDVSLTLLHIVVSVSYEFWLRYCRSKEWRALCAITVKVNSAHFARHIRLLGWFGLVMITGATLVICLGWEIPILSEVRSQFENGEYANNSAQFAFLFIHGIFMVVIVAPWAAVCMCSVCLFKLVVLAHQSDIESHFVTMKATLAATMEALATGHRVDAEQFMKSSLAAGEPGTPNSHRKGVSSSGIQPYFTHSPTSHQPKKRDLIAECFRPIVKHHQTVRARLRVTCAYFNWLYFAYMLLSTLLIFSSAMNVNRYIQGRPFAGDSFDKSWSTELLPHIVQDAFFLGLGIFGLYAIWYVPADCTRSFDRFVTRINDLVIAFPQASYTQSWTHIHPASLAGLTAYYNNSKTAYTLFGSPITFSLFVSAVTALFVVMFFTLWLVNF